MLYSVDGVTSIDGDTACKQLKEEAGLAHDPQAICEITFNRERPSANERVGCSPSHQTAVFKLLKVMNASERRAMFCQKLNSCMANPNVDTALVNEWANFYNCR
jgi:hypothetical protein